MIGEIIYTGGGTALIALGILWDFGDDGLLPFLIGVGVHLVSAIDAGISARHHNNKVRTEGFKLNFNPNLVNDSYLLSLSYGF